MVGQSEELERRGGSGDEGVSIRGDRRGGDRGKNEGGRGKWEVNAGFQRRRTGR